MILSIKKGAKNPFPIPLSNLLSEMVLLNRKLIKIKGQEIEPFLQRLITQDINKLKKKQDLYGALLTPQGKSISDFFIRLPKSEKTCLQKANSDYTIKDKQSSKTNTNELKAIFIDVADSTCPELIQKLRFYRLRLELDIKKTDLYCTALLLNKKNASMKKEILKKLNQSDSIIAFEDPRPNSLILQCFITQDLLTYISNQTRNTLSYKSYCHRNGFFELKEALPSDKSFYPIELNLDLLGAISFQKGCFIGQEVISRIHRKSNVRKRILPFILSKENNPNYSEFLDHRDKKQALQTLEVTFQNKKAGKGYYIFPCNTKQDFITGFALIRLDILSDFKIENSSIFSQLMQVKHFDDPKKQSCQIEIIKPDWWQEKKQSVHPSQDL